jgi:hypothetical protein
MSRFKGLHNDKKETAMNKGHLSALQTKHAELESQLELENTRPLPDADRIHRLKKQKLHIKDMLFQDRPYA